TFGYAGYTDTFCLTASNSSLPGVIFHITHEGSVSEGDCPMTPIAMQTINSTNCSTTRTLGYDARDNHTYWIQRMPDGKCWMLTNLAYAGGVSNNGTSGYGDTAVITAAT